MGGYRVVTRETAVDYLDGTEAAVRHCRNVANNVTSLLVRTFDDGLPVSPLRKPEIIDNYVAGERPGSRLTWTLGEPQPAFHRPEEAPMEWASSPAEWRVRAFYYALGQIESLWELSPLVVGDAVSFSYHWQAVVAADGLGVVTNVTMREAWVTWEAGRRASIEQGRPDVPAFHPAAQPGVDYLADGEHDPTLGPDMSDGRDT